MSIWKLRIYFSVPLKDLIPSVDGSTRGRREPMCIRVSRNVRRPSTTRTINPGGITRIRFPTRENGEKRLSAVIFFFRHHLDTVGTATMSTRLGWPRATLNPDGLIPETAARLRERGRVTPRSSLLRNRACISTRYRSIYRRVVSSFSRRSIKVPAYRRKRRDSVFSIHFANGRPEDVAVHLCAVNSDCRSTYTTDNVDDAPSSQ